MADITMCKGNNCPKKNECYRHLANASEHRQSFFMNIPYDALRKTCNEYIAVTKNWTEK